MACLPTLHPTSKSHTIYSMSCNNPHPLPPQDIKLTQSTIILCDRKRLRFFDVFCDKYAYTSSALNLTCDVRGVLSSAEIINNCLLSISRPKLLARHEHNNIVTVLNSPCIKCCYRCNLEGMIRLSIGEITQSTAQSIFCCCCYLKNSS